MVFERTLTSLARRAPFDRAARYVPFARRLAERLPDDAHVLSLGDGIGSVVRWFADVAGPPRGWRYTVVDSDARLLASVPSDVAAVDHRGWETLTELPANADAVLLTALNTVFAADLAGIARAVARSGLPVLAGPTPDGTVHWHPPHDRDDEVRAAVRLHHRAIGSEPDAARWLADQLRVRSYVVELAAAPWQIEARHRSVVRDLIEQTAMAAARGHPDRSIVEAWRQTRRLQAQVDALDVTVDQWDLFGSPR